MTSPFGVAESTQFTLVVLHLNTAKTKRQTLELAYWVRKIKIKKKRNATKHFRERHIAADRDRPSVGVSVCATSRTCCVRSASTLSPTVYILPYILQN